SRADAASPAVTPFAASLTVPPTAVPTSTTGGVDVYEIGLRTASVQILPGLQTKVYGYDGRYPGPTIRAEVGRPVHVTFVNDLPVPAAIHLHGGNVAPEDDGHPLDMIDPGDRRLYTYPNQQLAATYWYHDHAMDHTAENVYRGLAGLYLLHDPKEDALGLPSGDRDVPLLLQDRAFHSDGSLDYPEMSDPRSHNGVTGDVFLVNGVPSPKLAVERGRYRFRIVNGSNSRQYDLRLDGGASMVQIASDGGLLAGPVPVTHVPLGIAERAEIVVDFSAIDAGTSITMVDANSGTGMVRFDVGSSGAAGTVPPSILRTITPITGATVTRDVHLSFDEARQQWVINGKPFDPKRIDFRPRLGVPEQWRLTNSSTFVHPFHLHLVQFQVLKRGLANPPTVERGWKDTVRVLPNEDVLLVARFTGHTGTYVFHCHVLEHEDHSMMGQLRVVDLARVAGSDRAATAAAISARAFPNGASAVFVATGDSFADALAAGPAAAAAGGPILLVRGGALSQATRDELTRLAPKRITVVGGPGAVPEAVVDELKSHAPVTRVAGSDRYATAAAVARLVTNPPAVYVATGAGFADALVGGAAVAALKGALLLTERDRLPSATADALRALKPASIVVLGGTGAVSDAVESQLRALGVGTVERRAGADRYETAASINAKVFPAKAPAAFVATGTSFGDALAATPAAAAAGAPLVLTDPAALPSSARADLTRLAPARMVVVGGTAAVSTKVEDDLASML
ncbi:MAG: hypothetical protein QOD30_819, partial [Actinomycetota bacterium]|nr:hypothetical protein [Actinomycetota bacterium]